MRSIPAGVETRTPSQTSSGSTTRPPTVTSIRAVCRVSRSSETSLIAGSVNALAVDGNGVHPKRRDRKPARARDPGRAARRDPIRSSGNRRCRDSSRIPAGYDDGRASRAAFGEGTRHRRVRSPSPPRQADPNSYLRSSSAAASRAAGVGETSSANRVSSLIRLSRSCGGRPQGGPHRCGSHAPPA